jgi:hypothetical protein
VKAVFSNAACIAQKRQPSGDLTVNDVNDELLREAFSLLEGDAIAWGDASRQCIDIAAKLTGEEEVEYMLIAAAYYGRATILRKRLAVLKK